MFFDGECVMCNHVARRLFALDRGEVFHLAPLSGETARARLRGVPRLAGGETVVLLDESGVHVRSEAVLRTATRLGGVWRAAVVLRLLPLRVRDALYDFVARNRARWFGRAESCALLAPADRRRLLP